MTKTTLFGFDGSTYVRTVRCVLASKGVSYDQVPVNVLEGEPQEPEHLERHPFGKVPVLDIDGLRLRETDAIVRYLEARDPKPSMFPADAKVCAKADENAALIGNYGYGAITICFPTSLVERMKKCAHPALIRPRSWSALLWRIGATRRFSPGIHPGLPIICLGRSWPMRP